MATAVQAPKTVGPNLAGLTVREQAAVAWAELAETDRRKAERAARALAMTIFGNVSVEFDNFVSDNFANRHFFDPCQLVTFSVEGLEFNYSAATKDRLESLCLIDACPCGRGPRMLVHIRKLWELGRAGQWDFSDAKCLDCKADDKKAAAKS